MSSKPSSSQPFEGEKSLSDRAAERRPTAHPEKLSAWQRWEMNAIAAQIRPGSRAAKAGAESALGQFAPTLLIDEAELIRLRLDAQKAGRAEGYREGHALGQAEGYSAGSTAVQQQADQLHALSLTLPSALHLADRHVADALLALALDIARKVLGQALTVEPQAILAVVRELLDAEPALTGAPQLLLHPDDVALVKQHLSDGLQVAGWRIRGDATIKRGGCRVLAGSGERDATLDTRWERVAAALVQNVPTSKGTVDA